VPSIIRFEELTWPEVAALPRNLPLILPLGEGFDARQMAGQVAAALDADPVALLPALPYGWAGSAVTVEPDLLRRVIAGLLSGPREDGFTRLIVAHGGEADLPGVHSLRLDRAASPAPDPIRASPERVILIPCGHTEQHGYHLPLNTDTVIIDAIARAVVEAIPGEAERLPTLPYGVSTHRAAFAGTFNMGGRAFEDFLLAVLAALVARGADRFYLISGHGGNMSFLVNVVKYAGERHPGTFAATTWLHTSGRIAAPVVARYRRSGRGGMGHACELETAYMLHLRPDLCHMERVVDETDFISTPGYYMDWIEGGDLIANPPWTDDTQTGSYGAGSLATAEHGARWMAAAVEEKIAHVREIHEQQTRRLARRAARLNRRA
jgi:creatinine amidohydrolase